MCRAGPRRYVRAISDLQCDENEETMSLRTKFYALTYDRQMARAEKAAWARLQDRMNWLNRLVVSCDCNRPTLNSIRQAGFTITDVEHTALPKAPKFVRPAVIGGATAPAAAPSGSTSQLTRDEAPYRYQ
jgi:hypothetical protein